jgi:hypothetical protein
MPFIKSSLISILHHGNRFYYITKIYASNVFFIYSALVGGRLKGQAKLQIDLIAIKSIDNVKRETMHVQGISYWAPANIGPYSQSVIVSSLFPLIECCFLIPFLDSRPSLYCWTNWSCTQHFRFTFT